MKKINTVKTSANNDRISLKPILIAVAILLLGWMALKPTDESQKAVPSQLAATSATMSSTFNPSKAPTLQSAAKGVGLTAEEEARFSSKSPYKLKLFRAMADSGHPYMLEAVEGAKAMKIAFAIQKPPFDMGGLMGVEAQFTAQKFSDGLTRPVIYVLPTLLTQDIPDALVQRKMVHEYHHFKQWSKGEFEGQEATGANEVINLLKTEIPAWIVECEYSVYELKFLKDEKDICQGISRGGRKLLAWAVAENYVESFQDGRFRPFKTDVIKYLNSTEF